MRAIPPPGADVKRKNHDQDGDFFVARGRTLVTAIPHPDPKPGRPILRTHHRPGAAVALPLDAETERLLAIGAIVREMPTLPAPNSAVDNPAGIGFVTASQGPVYQR
jgi:hypothetical protein